MGGLLEEISRKKQISVEKQPDLRAGRSRPGTVLPTFSSKAQMCLFPDLGVNPKLPDHTFKLCV